MGEFVGALLSALLLIPIELWQAHARRVRSLSPHELNLRRATQPLGVVVLSLLAVWRFGLSDDITGTLATLIRDPTANPVPVGLLTAVLLYGLASLITGTCRSWGARGDGMLLTRAFIKLMAGIVGLVMFNSEPRGGGEFWPALLRLAVGAASIWCIVVGAGRLVLLTIGGSSPLGRVRRYIRQTQITMRPARSRPWWRFW